MNADDKRGELVELLARAMWPEGWAEFDASKGRVPNDVGWRLGGTVESARVALRFLAAERRAGRDRVAEYADNGS